MSCPDFVISLARLQSAEQHVRGSARPGDLGIEDEPRFRFHEPVFYDLTAALVSGRVLVQGTLRMACEMECRRCAEFFSTTVYISSFLRAYEIHGGMETVDLTEDVREDILLALPSFPLCTDVCKGLCPQCGKNLNEGPCGCAEQPERSGVWDALDAWRTKKEEKTNGES